MASHRDLDSPRSRPAAPGQAAPSHDPGLRGRGANANPANRFERLHYAGDEPGAEGELDEAEPRTAHPRTLLLRDPARSIIVTNDSPDVGFSASINPYRGCEHGCAYCYARPTHEYLGFSAGLDFETRILVKESAPELLRAELSTKRWQPQLLGLSGVTDAYQPAERRLLLTRRCLEVLLEFRNPVAVVTKNGLVARDADLLGELAGYRAACVNVSITSLDASLQRALEPRASHPDQRLAAITRLRDAGVPVGVLVAPVIPGLNDHEIPSILEASKQAGAQFAAFLIVRLPHGVAELFDRWLEQHVPERRERVLARIREVRGGKLSDSRFHVRHRGEGTYAEQLRALFQVSRRRLGLAERSPDLSIAAFRRGDSPQLSLF